MTPDLAWILDDAPLARAPAADLPPPPRPLAPGETEADRLDELQRDEAAYCARHGFTDGPDLSFCSGELTAWWPEVRLAMAMRAAPLDWTDAAYER